eukprot:m.36228 g.36228  ORF g.36228 m.36228 type:complete len:89 (+) comp14467_c0_seq2:258-524(+)
MFDVARCDLETDSTLGPASGADTSGSTLDDNDGGTESTTAFVVGAAVAAMCIGACIGVALCRRRSRRDASILEQAGPGYDTIECCRSV